MRRPSITKREGALKTKVAVRPCLLGFASLERPLHGVITVQPLVLLCRLELLGT